VSGNGAHFMYIHDYENGGAHTTKRAFDISNKEQSLDSLSRPAPPPFPGGRARAEVHKAGTGQRRTITGMASRSLRSHQIELPHVLSMYSFTVQVHVFISLPN